MLSSVIFGLSLGKQHFSNKCRCLDHHLEKCGVNVNKAPGFLCCKYNITGVSPISFS